MTRRLAEVSRPCSGCGMAMAYVRKPPKFCSACASTCRHEGCSRTSRTAGYCSTHYQRLRKFGSTLTPRHSPEYRVTWCCEQCKQQWITRAKEQRRFCNYACFQDSLNHGPRPVTEQRRRMYVVRKAKIKQGDRIDPIKVFERDGWHCQACGRETPQELRGTTSPRAPELDHFIPLSKGGSHTWANVRCTCKRCNLRKGSKHPLAVSAAA